MARDPSGNQPVSIAGDPITVRRERAKKERMEEAS